MTVNVPESRTGPLHIVNLVANRAETVKKERNKQKLLDKAQERKLDRERVERIERMVQQFRATPVHQYRRVTEKAKKERTEKYQQELNRRQMVSQIQQEEIRTFESVMEEIVSRIDSQKHEQVVAGAS